MFVVVPVFSTSSNVGVARRTIDFTVGRRAAAIDFVVNVEQLLLTGPPDVHLSKRVGESIAT